MVWAVRDQVYLDLEQAVKHWRVRLDIVPEKEDELREYLLSCLEEREGLFYRKEEGKSASISVELPV